MAPATRHDGDDRPRHVKSQLLLHSCLEFGGPYISLAEAFLRDDLTNLINHGVTDKFAR